MHALGCIIKEGGLDTKLHAKWQQGLYGSHQVKHGGGFPWRRSASNYRPMLGPRSGAISGTPSSTATARLQTASI